MPCCPWTAASRIRSAVLRTLARIPSSRVIVMDAASHVPYVSHPGPCLEALEPFLAEVDAHTGRRTQ